MTEWARAGYPDRRPRATVTTRGPAVKELAAKMRPKGKALPPRALTMYVTAEATPETAPAAIDKVLGLVVRGLVAWLTTDVGVPKEHAEDILSDALRDADEWR